MSKVQSLRIRCRLSLYRRDGGIRGRACGGAFGRLTVKRHRLRTACSLDRPHRASSRWGLRRARCLSGRLRRPCDRGRGRLVVTSQVSSRLTAVIAGLCPPICSPVRSHNASCVTAELATVRAPTVDSPDRPTAGGGTLASHLHQLVLARACSRLYLVGPELVALLAIETRQRVRAGPVRGRHRP